MNNKSIRNLLIIFLILFAIFLGKRYLPSLIPKTSLYKKYLGEIKLDDINQIEISKSQKLTFKKEEGLWRVEGKKANQTSVGDFLNAFFPKEEPEIISRTEGKQKELEVTEDLGFKVVLNQKITLFLGKVSYPGVYLRFDKANEVFFLKNFSSSLISIDLQNWVDKTVFSQDKDKIKSIKFVKQNKVSKVFKMDDKWFFEENKKEVEKEKIDGVLNKLSSLVAQSIYLNKEGKIYPQRAFLEMTIEYEEGEETLKFFKGKDDYLVERKSDGEKFIVGEYSLSDILKF